jgi:hypothetical protein
MKRRIKKVKFESSSLQMVIRIGLRQIAILRRIAWYYTTKQLNWPLAKERNEESFCKYQKVQMNLQFQSRNLLYFDMLTAPTH